MKKFLALTLCMVMTLAVLSSCTSSAPPTELSVYFFGANVTDDTSVVAAANARLKALGINATIKPIWGNWDDTPLRNILDTGDTSVDIVFTCSWAANYVEYAKKGSFVRLDDPNNNLLDKYGKNMKAAVPDLLWDGFTVETQDGLGLYGVPGYKDYAQLSTFDINNTRLAELGFDINSFTWNGDVIFDPRFEEAMMAAKEAYGSDFYPLLPEPDNFVRAMTYSDADMTGLGVLDFSFDPNDPSKPVNPTVGLILENERYLKTVEKLYEFYQKGYIDPRCAIKDESSAAITGSQETANYLFSQRTYAYGFDATASKDRGIDAKFMPISKAVVSTVPVQGSGFAISAYSKNKDLAMQFLNAWYTDKELATILCYGVENTHYTTNADGTITTNVEARKAFSPWRNGMGNIFVLPPQDVEGVNYYTEFQAYNDAGIGTGFLGFNFNRDPVANELAALLNVTSEFQTTVTTGAVDPAVAVPQYIEKLKANGIDKVIDEFNKQLQSFYASK